MGQQADLVRQDILNRVRRRALLPTERIDEADLGKRLGVSGTPIREALIALEAVGVIERRPRDGARIKGWQLEDLLKSVEVLAECEAAAAYRAARRINAVQAARLEAAAQNCLAYAEAPGQSDVAYYDLNLSFHLALLDASGNEHLERTALTTGDRLIAYLACRHDLPAEIQKSAKDHMAICDAVRASNGDLARSLMLQHVVFDDTIALDVQNLMAKSSPG